MEKENQKVRDNFHLWWVNTKSNKRFYAGRAYYNEEKGDYALIINFLESSYETKKSSEIYLRPINTLPDHSYFRVEKVISRKGKSDRFPIGDAWLSKETQGDIFINIEPLTSFHKKLVLTLPEKNEEKK